MVQPPPAAPPEIDPMVLQQQQAAAQEAALQQVTPVAPNLTYFYKSHLRVFSLGIRSQIRFLGTGKTSC